MENFGGSVMGTAEVLVSTGGLNSSQQQQIIEKAYIMIRKNIKKHSIDHTTREIGKIDTAIGNQKAVFKILKESQRNLLTQHFIIDIGTVTKVCELPSHRDLLIILGKTKIGILGENKRYVFLLQFNAEKDCQKFHIEVRKLAKDRIGEILVEFETPLLKKKTLLLDTEKAKTSNLSPSLNSSKISTPKVTPEPFSSLLTNENGSPIICLKPELDFPTPNSMFTDQILPPGTSTSPELFSSSSSVKKEINFRLTPNKNQESVDKSLQNNSIDSGLTDFRNGPPNSNSNNAASILCEEHYYVNVPIDEEEENLYLDMEMKELPEEDKTTTINRTLITLLQKLLKFYNENHKVHKQLLKLIEFHEEIVGTMLKDENIPLLPIQIQKGATIYKNFLGICFEQNQTDIWKQLNIDFAYQITTFLEEIQEKLPTVNGETLSNVFRKALKMLNSFELTKRILDSPLPHERLGPINFKGAFKVQEGTKGNLMYIFFQESVWTLTFSRGFYYEYHSHILVRELIEVKKKGETVWRFRSKGKWQKNARDILLEISNIKELDSWEEFLTFIGEGNCQVNVYF